MRAARTEPPADRQGGYARASPERRLGSGPALHFFPGIHGGQVGSFSSRLRNMRLQVHWNSQIVRVWTALAKWSRAPTRSPAASRDSAISKCAKPCFQREPPALAR